MKTNNPLYFDSDLKQNIGDIKMPKKTIYFEQKMPKINMVIFFNIYISTIRSRSHILAKKIK